MKRLCRYFAAVCIVFGLVAVVLLMTTPSATERVVSAALPTGREAQLIEPLSALRPEAPPVIFPPDPGWPSYAQREITVHPEPPLPGHPTQVCARVVNTTDVTQTVTLDFGVANFGIGLDFMPIGARTIEVPPFAKVKACVVWIPRQPGHWCIQVLLKQMEQIIGESQRNIDIWESLSPGEPAHTVFPVHNSTGVQTNIELSPTRILPGWIAYLTPPMLLNMGVTETRLVTLTVVPPQGRMLGSREPIVDVEARDVQRNLIGGFRKLDMPPVPLHRLKDPPYAESEISIDPYPSLPGEPVNICAELRNLSDVPQEVHVSFQAFNPPELGIGLPWGPPFGEQTVVIPPRGLIKVCTTWIPVKPGQFCIQVHVQDPLRRYVDQWSQLNLDVNEVLRPGKSDHLVFQVGNPLTVSTDISLTVPYHDSFFDVFVEPPLLPGMAPGDQRTVTLTVAPRAGMMPEEGTLVADVEARYLNAEQQWELIGGIRKLLRPPIPVHRPQEPPYGESEISVVPYPPRAGEPVQICAELRNPTNEPQKVQVEFGVINFGIGLPFAPIDRQDVELPPLSRTRVCTRWVPPIGGHFCAQIIVRQPGYQDVISQRNLDVAEYLRPNVTDHYAFPVGNPYPDRPITITLGLVQHLGDWQASLDPVELVNVQPRTFRMVTLTVKPPADLTRVPDGALVLDVEAIAEGRLIGGFRKLFRPPIPIHRPEDPPYAEREISIEPYPPRAGEPTQICVELRNPTAFTQSVWLDFEWANFGIGLPWQPIQRRKVDLPPHSLTRHCVNWIPPFGGHFCVQIRLNDVEQRYAEARSQRNMDVGEVFKPGEWTQPFVFRVGNPFTHPVNIELAAFVHLKEWQAQLQPRVLNNVPAGAVLPVTLTVFVPRDKPLPPDDTPLVDVEAHTIGAGQDSGRLIGGFRKLYRPPVPIHRPKDPIYAESEIHIEPYPPRERQPTQICVDLRNPTVETQTFTVTLAVADFGIGLPFHDILRPITVTLPPNSIRQVCVKWVPPHGGKFCVRTTIQVGGHDPVWSQRNMDVGEVVKPGEPAHLSFPVGNPTTGTVTVTLGLVPHVAGWGLELSQGVLPHLQPHEVRPVTLTVIPPRQGPLPLPDAPVVDVEAFIERELIGGFRKIYHPPVPLHRPQDPVYAESEIFVDPYPTRAGVRTLLGAVVFNPTDEEQTVTVTFGVANFGIGLPFTTTGIMTPTMAIRIPPRGAARAQTFWLPPFSGHFCVRIWLESDGHEPVWSQRNVDVGEPLRLGVPHARRFVIGNPMTDVVTITLALVNHRPGWQAEVWPATLPDMAPGMTRTITLTVTPPLPPEGPERDRERLSLADERPVVDLEAYVEGELIGGIRKIAKPPIPLHKPQDQPYAESEIGVTPYPLSQGRPATITTDIMNTSENTQTIRVLFGVANFGFGIPFTTTGILTTSTVVTLGPGISQTVWTVWTPPAAGNWCVQIILQDPNNQYPEQRSQRNVVVERRPYQLCVPFTKEFWLQNSMGLAVTVSIGAGAINLPQGWTYSTNVTETALGPYAGITVTLTITPPCSLAGRQPSAGQSLQAAMLDTGGASGPPTIDVAGYTQDGELLGGIQVQLEGVEARLIYLPIVLRQ